MGKQNRIWLVAMSLGALLALPMPAFALDVFLPSSGGWTVIGNTVNNGVRGAWALHASRLTGACRFYFLGDGGLASDVTIWGSATAWDDITAFADQGVFLHNKCGNVTFTALVTNARRLTIRSGGGDDTLVDENTGAWLVGDSGNDWIGTITGGGGGQLYGTGGNDTMWGTWGQFLYGEAGNDTMCANSGMWPAQLDGGSGTDTYCGTTYFGTPNVESQNCSRCTFKIPTHP